MFFYILITLCICIDDPKLVFSSPHPTALQHGIAKDLTADMFSSADYLDYTDGIICVVCLCSATSAVSKMDSWEELTKFRLVLEFRSIFFKNLYKIFNLFISYFFPKQLWKTKTYFSRVEEANKCLHNIQLGEAIATNAQKKKTWRGK